MFQIPIKVRGLTIAIATMLGGCLPHEPLPYSPHYSSIGLVDSTPAVESPVGKARNKQHARSRKSPQSNRTVLVPDACITPDRTEQSVYLPPGCANNLNLQLMVERPRDLVQGRRPGPAAAAPTVRAAEQYLYGGTEAERRTGKAKQEPTITPPPTPQGSRTDAR
jgi:hypothetical protein